jgi:hypothetical protein
MHNSSKPVNHSSESSLQSSSIPHNPTNNPIQKNSHPTHQANITTALPKTIHKPTQMLPNAVRSEPAPNRFPATAAALLLAAPPEPLLLTLPLPLALAFAGTASVPVATPMVLLPVLAAKVSLPLTASAME